MGSCLVVDATICERQDQADKQKSRLVTAQVLRLLDMPSGMAKKEKFAVKGLERRTPLTGAHEEHPLPSNE